jgi:hypothetical protein
MDEEGVGKESRRPGRRLAVGGVGAVAGVATGELQGGSGNRAILYIYSIQ